jgi:hypothetical protein
MVFIMLGSPVRVKHSAKKHHVTEHEQEYKIGHRMRLVDCHISCHMWPLT